MPGSRLFEDSKKKARSLSEKAKSDEEKGARVKKPPVNPAAEGAKLDRKGVRYSGDKGNKTFFSKRKQNIERVNERLGFSVQQEASDDE